MKIYIHICLLIIGSSVFSQTIDTTVLIVTYNLDYVKDPNSPTQLSNDIMKLAIGETCSEFYSYIQYKADSALEIDTQNGLTPDERMSNRNKYRGSYLGYNLFKNKPLGSFTFYDKIVLDNYYFVYPQTQIPWKLENEHKQILNYQCQKASVRYKGRNYIAWFTNDIPLNEGPWEFHGLPGLILEIYDAQEHYHFTCIGVVTSKEPIKLPTRDYQKITREKYRNLKEKVAKDFAGYVNSTSNMKIEIENSKKYRNRPFNPIDLE